jgi:hypothetical protein
MCAPRPLQIPRQVGFAGGLCALFADVLNPLLAEHETVEGVGLEDAEGDDGGESARDQKRSDQ